jgi:signal transduction histidine kinase
VTTNVVLLVSAAVQLSGALMSTKYSRRGSPGIVVTFLSAIFLVLFFRSSIVLIAQGFNVLGQSLDLAFETMSLIVSSLLFGVLHLLKEHSPTNRIDLPIDQSIRHNQLLRATLESTAEGIFVVDNTGKHLLSNTRFAEMWRIPSSLMVKGADIYSHDYVVDQLDDPLKFQTYIGNLNSSLKADIFDLRFLDGRLFECYTVPLVHGEQNFGRIWSFRDITLLKRTEDTAMLYLDLMSHDIRNRLQGIAMSIELLNMMVEDPSSTETLSDIERNVQRCAILISKVKATERIDEAPLFNRPLATVIQQSVKAIRTRFDDIEVDYTSETQEAIVKSDKFLETLLINLLENAVIHNPKDDRHIWVSLRKLDQGYEVSIADNGIGIGDELKADLFDKNRRYGGVGLHLVSHISDKYGGSLQVVDRIAGEPDQGLEFRVWIPGLQGD